MAQEYHPLVEQEEAQSSFTEKPLDHDVELKGYNQHDTDDADSDDESDLDLNDVDLEKLPQESRPKWYQLPKLSMHPSWDMTSKWDIQAMWNERPDAKTMAWLVLGYILATLPRYMQPGGMKCKKDLHPTAYLDALRGWAALAVFRYHGMANKTPFLEWPVFRMVMNGRAMVDIFFVISGYALSYRMLKMLRNRQPALLKALASSSFRRWWRLYASCSVASLITAFWSYMGWCQPRWRQPTIWLQIADWMWDTGAASNPFGDIRGWWYGDVFRTKYLDQMWTIPVEFRGSLVLFWFLAAAAYLSTRGRRIFCLVTVTLLYYWGSIYAASFLLGMMIADLSFDRHPERLTRIRLSASVNSEGPDSKPRAQAIAMNVFWVAMVILSMLLLGQPPPEHDLGRHGSFPWPYLRKVVPFWYPLELAEHFWLSWGSVLLVFAIDNCRMLQKPFEWGFSQYLGDLSFGVYAMHNPLYWALYTPIVEPWRAAHLGEGYWAGMPGVLFQTLVVLAAADYFSRIDNRVVRVGKWLETKTFIDWD
jgi:peptidoglycan/LPS O-acetylase OafA/YrhL